MKTKISHLGRSTVSVILAVMMLLSTMLIGTISVNAAGYFTVGDTLYLDISGVSFNETDNNAGFYIKFYKYGTSDFSWSKLSQIENSKVYSGTVPSGNWDHAVFTRVKNAFNSGVTWDKDNIYSSADTTIAKKGDKNCWSLNDGKMNGTWTTYSGGSGGGSTEATYYLGGRVGQNLNSGTWLGFTKDYQFQKTETSGLYKYVSTQTPAQWKALIGDLKQYFFVHTGSSAKWYGSIQETGLTSVNQATNLKEYSDNDTNTNRLLYINSSDTSGNVTFWFDTRNSDKQLYYTVGSESSLTPVAESVTLTASPETVTAGNSVTLTATAVSPAVNNVTYTFKKTSGGSVNESPNGNTLTVTPTEAGTYKYTVTVSAEGYSPVTSTEVSFTVAAPVTYYLGGRVAQSANDSGWIAPDSTTNTSCKFVETETDGLYKYESNQTPAAWSEKRNNLLQYFYVRTSLGGALYYGNAESGNDALALTAQGQKANLAEIYNTDVKNLIYIDSKDTSTNATFWLDTRNGKYNLWYTTALSHKVNVAEGVSATVDKETATAGETVTVKATPGTGEVLDKVTVVGKDGSTQIETTVSGNNATFKMPDQDVTVKEVTFRPANKYTVTFRSSDNNFGTVSAKHNDADFNSGTTVTEGDEVTFTATTKDGYALSDWTVTANGTSNTYNDSSLSLKITANTTVVANFKVEDSGTIVNDMYFLYGSTNNPTSWEGQQGYNNSEYGKYDVYKKDGKYIVTLNKEHYKQLYFAFSTSNYYKNMTPKDKLAGVNPDNPVDLRLVTTGKESFNADNTQYVFGMMSIVSENSEYIGDIKIIYDPTANTYTVKATKDSVSDTTVNIVGKDGTVRANYYGKTTSALGDTKLKVTSPDGTTITAIDSCNFDGHCQGVTAKKVPYGSTVTVTTTINPDATFAGHNGSEYYVKGFSINGFTGGVLTQQDGSSHTDNVYEYTFTVKDDVYADVSTIEITPIYFLKNDSNCVTFYVENFMEAKAKWGDTIACYAYYSSGNDSGNALGDYPGQPMVNAEGSIYMQIPKYIGDGDDQSNVVKGITLNNYVWDFVHVSGDDGVRESKNCQTYDYDDFKYLANMSKVNSSDSLSDIKNIVYRFKYHTYNNTSDDASAAIGNVPKDTLPETTVDNTKYEVFVDYYDKPTDIFGTIINGNDAVTVGTVKKESKYLTIVSDGYVNYYKDTDNYLGQYATKWYIYNETGQKVAALPPSALLYGLTKSSSQLETLVTQQAAPEDFMSDSGANTTVISGYWDSFKSLYNQYAGKYAIINYESAIHSKGRDEAKPQMGERCDGRWYYSVDKAKITGDIKIEYADTLDSFTTMKGVNTDTIDVDTATGKNTAAEAYFTSPAGQSTTGKPIHVETTSDNSENFMFTVGATSSTTKGYTFVGWYRLIDDTYKAVNDPSELNKTTGQVARNANVVLVARYIKTPGGSMTFNHSLYEGENAGGGKATTKIQVVVKSRDGIKEYYNSGIIDSTASIDQKTISKIVTAQLTDQQDAEITVTLYTTTKNLYNFNGYYSAENAPVTKPFTDGFTKDVTGNRKEGRVTKSVYTFSFNDYYNKHRSTLIGDNAGTVYYNFYSDITSIKVPYKVQFSYKDRMEKQKYYNKAGYVDPENTSSYTIVEDGNDDVKVTLTDSFILSLAPYESNFAKDLTWKETPDINNPFNSSVPNSIASAVLNSTQSDKKIYLNVFRDKKTNEPTSRDNKNGDFELYKKNGSPKLPYGSVFYTSNDDGTYTYDITAPKTYEGKQFMYWAIYSDSRCRKEDLVINAYNSEGHFSYVAYDNCWIVPVYGESSTPVASVKEVYTSTQFMEVTRNQWTADTNSNFAGFDADSMNTLDTNEDFIKVKGEDKLYADFVLNFFYNGKQLSVFDPDSNNVKAGVLIQRLELDENETGTGCITDLNHYANKYSKAELEQAKNDAINKINNKPSTIKSVKQQIDNSRLDNKNRLQYYTLFNNVKGNNNCVFRLYTYIKYTDADGKSAVELSDPVYFTFYDIANKS